MLPSGAPHAVLACGVFRLITDPVCVFAPLAQKQKGRPGHRRPLSASYESILFRVHQRLFGKDCLKSFRLVLIV